MFDDKNSIGAYPIAPLGMCPVRHCQIVIGFPRQNDCKEYRVKSIGEVGHIYRHRHYPRLIFSAQLESRRLNMIHQQESRRRFISSNCSAMLFCFREYLGRSISTFRDTRNPGDGQGCVI